MPTYEYECRFCSHRFDHFQGFSDPLLRKCPECGRHGLTRLIGTGGGILFKGSGFYETDYKRAGRPKGEEGDAPASGGDKPAGGDKGGAQKTPGSSKPGKSDPARPGGGGGSGGD